MISDRWGVSDSEVARSYPCDEFVVPPAWQAWRGVDVAAPAAAVWPWVAQVRLAPYSYDWIDNRGRRSPRDLTGTIMGAFMSYVLVPEEHDSTRLLLKVVMRTTRVKALGLSVGDLVMARRQLLNLKRLAERPRPAVNG
jgi:hypothetical protein